MRVTHSTPVRIQSSFAPRTLTSKYIIIYVATGYESDEAQKQLGK